MGSFQKTDKVAISYLNRTIEASRGRLEGLSQGANPHKAYDISYNAALQFSHAHKLRKGFRPRGSSHHATVVPFMNMTMDEEYRNLVNLFDQKRRKRNRLVYGRQAW
jgi:hypothetical protein